MPLSYRSPIYENNCRRDGLWPSESTYKSMPESTYKSMLAEPYKPSEEYLAWLKENMPESYDYWYKKGVIGENSD